MTYEDILLELIEKDERFVVLTAENRAAIRNLPNKVKGRFIDTGITEQTLIGVSAGLALRGRIPVCHALATFLTMRAFEFIRTDVGISGLPVKIVGGFSGFLSDGNGPTHQAIEDVSIMRGIPNVNVFCPADEEDMLICLRTVLEDPRPFYIRYNNYKNIYSHNHNFEVGKAEIVSKGNDVTIITYGLIFGESYKSMNLLKEKGYDTGLINLRTVKPIDESAILDAVKNSKLIVTVEDHFKTGGLYSILSEILLNHKITTDVLSISLDNKWYKPALLNDVMEYEGFTAPKITEKIISKLKS